jgi:ketosteroid isomerase-like protein
MDCYRSSERTTGGGRAASVEKGNCILGARFVIISCLLAATAFGQVAEKCVLGDYMAQTEDERLIAKAELDWYEGATDRDAAKLAAVFADDLIWVTEKGAMMDKQAAIKRYLTEVNLDSLHFSEFTIRVFGNQAVVTAHVAVRGTRASGEKIDYTHGTVDVFVKRNGHWQCIAT